MKRPAIIWLVLTLLSGGAMMAMFALGFASGAAFLGLAIVAVVLLGLRDICEASHQKTARQEEMQQTAARLGSPFHATAHFNVLGWSDAFHLTRDGMKTQRAVQDALPPQWGSMLLPKSRNVIQRSIDDGAVAVFDYECDKPGYEDVTARQTVLAVKSSRLVFPHFALLPATWWGALVDKLRGNVASPDRYRRVSKSTHCFAIRR